MSPTWRWEVELAATVGTLRLEVGLAGGLQPVALIGPNGAGKTSLLRILAGARAPERGRFEVNGEMIFDTDNGVWLPPEARRVGYVPQGFGLFPHLSAVRNVAFGYRGGDKAQSEAAAREMLRSVDGAEVATRMPAALSGGEQQRVALARALIADPSMLLLDEPLAAMDPIARRRLRAFLSDHITQNRRPTLVVTHDARDVRSLDAFVFVLEAGRIVQSGEWSKVAEAPASEFVAEFFDL